MTQTLNDGEADRRVGAGSITAPPWAFAITPAAAQLINTSRRVVLTPRSSSDEPVGRIEGILPHVVDPQTISFHLPGGVMRELARRPLGARAGVLTIAFGHSSELALWGTVVAIAPMSETGSKPGSMAAAEPGYRRVEFRMAFLTVVGEARTIRDMAWWDGGRKISSLSQLEMEGLLARCSQ